MGRNSQVLAVAALLVFGAVGSSCAATSTVNTPWEIVGRAEWTISQGGAVIDQGGGLASFDEGALLGNKPFGATNGLNTTEYRVVPRDGWVGDPGLWVYRFNWWQPYVTNCGPFGCETVGHDEVLDATLTTGAATYEFGSADKALGDAPRVAFGLSYTEPSCPNDEGMRQKFTTLPFAADPDQEFALTLRWCLGSNTPNPIPIN